MYFYRGQCKVGNNTWFKVGNNKVGNNTWLIPCLLLVFLFFAVITPIPASAGWIELNITTEADVYSVGETITYTLSVSNSDSVGYTLNVTNTYPDGTEELLDTNLYLPPGENETYTRYYVVQATDVGADKMVKNTLAINGTNDMGDEIIAKITKRTRILTPAIAIIKTASLDGTCPGYHSLNAQIGDTVTYCFNVINTGDVELSGIEVTDAIYGQIELRKNTLMPDESTSGKMTYVITDSDQPVITNIANVSGITDEGVVVSDDDNCVVTVSTSTETMLSVIKDAEPSEGVNGTVINFTIMVYNSGVANLSPVYINDSLPLGLEFVSATDGGENNGQWVNWSLGELAPAESRTVYLNARLNVNASQLGMLINHVNVSGEQEDGSTVTSDAEASVRAYTTPPDVVDFIQSSDSPVADENVTITAHVTDDMGVQSVNLTYINVSNHVTTVKMTRDSGTILDGYWSATIPGQPAGTVLTIYITACDITGNCTTTLPHMKHWSEDLTKLCPLPGADRKYPALPRSTTPHTRTETLWYPHYPGNNPLCTGIWA